uniref:Uncharacterized protein n=1 Tax=Arundo donax TaxID=35708 RepID=A0A0A9FLH4_ARUDO
MVGSGSGVPNSRWIWAAVGFAVVGR